jgi:thiol:disulfide interchange protein
MKMVWKLALAATILFALQGSLLAQTFEGRELVKPELVADSTAVAPNKSFTVGLVLHMAPGWHTYWKFSGDAGLPTEIKWNLPPGWKVGDIQWPIPQKTNDPGDIQTYGYQNEVMLMQEITPLDKIDNNAVTLIADVNWLVCERICIPGHAKLSIALPRSDTSAPANVELFAKYRNLLPRGFLGPDVLVSETRDKPTQLSITLKSPGFAKYGFADFYPLPNEQTVVGHPKTEIRDEQISVQVPFESQAPSNIDGLLILAKNAADPDRIGWYVSTSAAASRPANTTSTAPSRGLFTFLFFGFVGGFILNLMPCVLPVISLKIFGFIQHAGQDRRRIFRSGLAFIAGIFAWFIALALILIAFKAAGQQITWSAQFTNPYFILLLGALVLVFALNLFGVFEISLPQSIAGLLTSSDRKDDAGSFFQGVFATVLATPCTAPFLGTALGFAFTQSALVILAMFLAIAAGMSAPYLILSAQPAWLRFLPRPGPWMLRVKQLMGFLLLATLLFLLYVLGAQRGLEGAVWASSFYLIVAIICWMKGAFVLPTTSRATRAFVFLIMLLLLFSSGFYFVGDKFRSAKIENLGPQTVGDWQSFSPERLQAELQQNHPVFIDFTAAWCITCKFNERTVLESSAIRDAFRRHGIIKLRADWTNGDPAITKLLQQFGRPGVPLYVLYRGQAGEPYVFPELLTKSTVLQELETVSSTVASQ